MKAFIFVVILCASIAGVLRYLQQADEQLCQSSGYDGMKHGLCVYHSRYASIDYTAEPKLARDWIADVHEYEEKRRRGED